MKYYLCMLPIFELPKNLTTVSPREMLKAKYFWSLKPKPSESKFEVSIGTQSGIKDQNINFSNFRHLLRFSGINPGEVAQVFLFLMNL